MPRTSPQSPICFCGDASTPCPTGDGHVIVQHFVTQTISPALKQLSYSQQASSHQLNIMTRIGRPDASNEFVTVTEVKEEGREYRTERTVR
jgi:hypothetical protein